jgi:hypothetical protein
MLSQWSISRLSQHTVSNSGPSNTYNGALGKKKSNTEDTFLTQLQAFKDGVAVVPSGTSVYPLKGTLDDARKRLEKTGYTKK